MSKNKMNEKSTSTDVSLDGTVQTTDNSIDKTVDMNMPNVDSKTGINVIEEPKASINTKKAAEAVAAGTASGFGSAPATFSRGGTIFSGGAGQVGNDLSATTRGTDSYRSGDRTGKRLDSISRKLDLLNAEIVKTKVYESKPLAETDSKQGYNGNYNNEHAITQKVNGGHPGDPLFNRSADEIRTDMIYFADGQYVTSSDNYGEYEIHNYDVPSDNYSGNVIDMKRGSYFNRNFEFDVTQSGDIINMSFDTTDISVRNADELTVRASSDAALRNVNRRELDRTQIIANAGNESDLKWSCLGDALYDASAQNTLLADLDSTAGDLIYLSRRKLAQALAYQINKTAKDGSRIAGPIAEMCNGLVPNINAGSVNYVSEEDGFNQTFNNAEVLMNGGAGLWLRLNDSITKYNTKAKLLNLPLSFKSALNTANANCHPFRMHEQLKSIIEKNELFSTIDGPYDPMKAVVHTDAASLVLPFDLNKTIKTDNKGNNTFDIYTMHYENLRNKYNIKIKNFFLSGIQRWLKERGSKLFSIFSKDLGEQAEDGKFHISIPMVSSSSSISLWDLIVCSAVPYMVEERIQTLTEVLKYERNFSYPYSGTIALKDVGICEAENFSFVDADNALTTAIAKPIAAMKIIMPEIFWPVDVKSAESYNAHNGKGCKVVLPHYFVQNQFSYTGNPGDNDRRLLLSDEYGCMAYPSTRSGNMFSYMDTIYGMSEEDYRLSLDRMTVYPGYQGTSKYATKAKFVTTGNGNVGSRPVVEASAYKYGATADGQPVLTYFAYANSKDHIEDVLSVEDILSTPRELGLLMVAPAGLLTPIKVDEDTANTVSPKSSYLGMSGPGFKLITYHTPDKQASNEILSVGSVNIDISGSIRGVWELICANPFGSKYSKGWALNASVGYTALRPFTKYGFEQIEYDYVDGTYTNSEVQDTDAVSIYSSARYMWTRMQRLPFAINPFDANVDYINAESSDTSINDVDIYDFLYMLGLCGFRASDYTALINERVKYRIVKGMDYLDDPFVIKTNLLK